MPLWGKDTDAESRPKYLPIDSNAAGSGGARENAIAVSGGWGLTPGIGATGNDNKAAQPEVLVCISNLAEVFGAGVKQKRSKFIDIRLERFLAPTLDICKGGYETQTSRGFKPSLSFTQ